MYSSHLDRLQGQWCKVKQGVWKYVLDGQLIAKLSIMAAHTPNTNCQDTFPVSNNAAFRYLQVNPRCLSGYRAFVLSAFCFFVFFQKTINETSCDHSYKVFIILFLSSLIITWLKKDACTLHTSSPLLHLLLWHVKYIAYRLQHVKLESCLTTRWFPTWTFFNHESVHFT